MWRSLVAATALAGVVAAAAGARDPWDPRTKIRNGDQTKAAATLVTRGDLGSGWTGGARKPTSFKAPTCPAQRPNDGDLTVTGHADFLYLGVGRSLIYVNIIAPSVQESQLPGFEVRLAKLMVARAAD